MVNIQHHVISHIDDRISGHILGVAGYYSDIDSTQHVVVAMNDDSHGGRGTLYEIHWNRNTQVTHTVTNDQLLWQFSTIHSLSGFYTPDDDFQHVIVATADGWLHELYFKDPRPQNVLGGNPLLGHTIPPGPPIGQAGFYTPEDRLRHAIVGGTDGVLHEVVWNAPTAHNLATPFGLQDVASIAGFFDLCFHSRDVIVAMKETSVFGASVFDVHYSGGILAGGQITTDLVTTFTAPLVNVVNVAAFISIDTGYRHVIVLDSSGQLYDYSYTPEQVFGLTPLVSIANVADIVGYYSHYDHMRHVIVATLDRNIHDVYYGPVELS